MGFNVRQEYLFQQQDFIGHSGKPLTWKIECDAIQDVEWATLAHMIQELERRPFGEVVGIPRGGLKLSGPLNLRPPLGIPTTSPNGLFSSSCII